MPVNASGHPLTLQVTERDVRVDRFSRRCLAPSRQFREWRVKNGAAIIFPNDAVEPHGFGSRYLRLIRRVAFTNLQDFISAV